MAKRVKMIAPFDVFTGNVSGKQELKYAKHDNPAFEAPDGMQYARNYKARYIVAQRNSDGLAYFGVRRRSAVNNTPASRLQQSALGAAAALVTEILENPTWGTQADSLLDSYTKGVRAGVIKEKSIRAWLVASFLPALKQQQAMYYAVLYNEDGTSHGTVSFYSPWGDQQFDPTRNPNVSQATLLKFWMWLAPNAITFTIDGLVGYAFTDMAFGELAARADLNVLGVHITGEDNHVVCGKRGNKPVFTDADEPCVSTTDIVGGMHYVTKDE